jgi:hypothetical protein
MGVVEKVVRVVCFLISGLSRGLQRVPMLEDAEALLVLPLPLEFFCRPFSFPESFFALGSFACEPLLTFVKTLLLSLRGSSGTLVVTLNGVGDLVHHGVEDTPAAR